jgi:GT2 family glycosyltransferase
MTHISIIIVHFNTPTDTTECLLSLSKITHPGFSFSILVVDNGSKVEYKLPKSLSPTIFSVIRSESNLGFTGGNNLGIYQAIEKHNSEFVLLLNNDTVVDHRFLTELYRTSSADPSIGMCSPKIYFYPGNEYFSEYSKKDRGRVFWYAGGSIDWKHLTGHHRGVDEIDRGHFDSQKYSDFATGCCVLIRREVLEKTGSLDKNYFLYFEDVDLSLKAVEAGYTLRFEPKAIVWHKNASSSGGTGSTTHEYYQTRNRLYFGIKHGDWKVRITTLRVALQTLISGSRESKIGVLHAALGFYGKQAIV